MQHIGHCSPEGVYKEAALKLPLSLHTQSNRQPCAGGRVKPELGFWYAPETLLKDTNTQTKPHNMTCAAALLTLQ
jgi:hypothetical protein